MSGSVDQKEKKAQPSMFDSIVQNVWNKADDLKNEYDHSNFKRNFGDFIHGRNQEESLDHEMASLISVAKSFVQRHRDNYRFHDYNSELYHLWEKECSAVGAITPTAVSRSYDKFVLILFQQERAEKEKIILMAEQEFSKQLDEISPKKNSTSQEIDIIMSDYEALITSMYKEEKIKFVDIKATVNYVRYFSNIIDKKANAARRRLEGSDSAAAEAPRKHHHPSRHYAD